MLFKELHQFPIYDNLEFYPIKPTKAFINVLLKNDYAFKLTPDFVVSYMKFLVDIKDVYKNPRIKRFYKNSSYPFPYKANLFDMNLSSVMFRDPILEVVKYSDFFALIEPRKYDLRKYKLRKKLKKVSEKYIDDRYAVWNSSSRKIESFIERKEDEIDELLLVENMLGSAEELSDDFMSSLNENDLTPDDGFRIREHIVERLDCGELTERSYPQRVSYLLNHMENIDKQTEFYNESLDECPFCGGKITDSMRSCVSCGLSIRELDFEQHAAEKLNNTMNGLFDRFMEAMQSGTFFDDGEDVAIEDDDEMYDLKVFYNEHMRDYEYDEFLKFYKSSDRNLSIEEIRDEFLEDKLEKSRNSKDELQTYFIYLVHYFYYNLEFDRFEDAFVNLLQMIILASNKSKDEKDIINSNPHFIDILFGIEEMENTNQTFDVSELFDKAVKTFKIDKYNNNHEKVLRQFNETYQSPV